MALDLQNTGAPVQAFYRKGWKTLYSVDFTALASQTFTASAYNTIDGKSVWVGPFSVGNGAIVNGSGLKIAGATNANSTIGSQAAVAWALDQFEFDPFAQLLMMFHFQASSLDQSSGRVLGGFTGLPPAGATMTALPSFGTSAAGVAQSGTSPTLAFWQATNYVMYQSPFLNPLAASGVAGASSYVCGVFMASPNTAQNLYGAWGGSSLPEPAGMTPYAVRPVDLGTGSSSAAQLTDKFAAYLATNHGGNGWGGTIGHFTHMKILKRT